MGMAKIDYWLIIDLRSIWSISMDNCSSIGYWSSILIDSQFTEKSVNYRFVSTDIDWFYLASIVINWNTLIDINYIVFHRFMGFSIKLKLLSYMCHLFSFPSTKKCCVCGNILLKAFCIIMHNYLISFKTV